VRSRETRAAELVGEGAVHDGGPELGIDVVATEAARGAEAVAQAGSLTMNAGMQVKGPAGLQQHSA
jgi:hypothetical protein